MCSKFTYEFSSSLDLQTDSEFPWQGWETNDFALTSPRRGLDSASKLHFPRPKLPQKSIRAQKTNKMVPASEVNRVASEVRRVWKDIFYEKSRKGRLVSRALKRMQRF